MPQSLRATTPLGAPKELRVNNNWAFATFSGVQNSEKRQGRLIMKPKVRFFPFLDFDND